MSEDSPEEFLQFMAAYHGVPLDGSPPSRADRVRARAWQALAAECAGEQGIEPPPWPGGGTAWAEDRAAESAASAGDRSALDGEWT